MVALLGPGIREVQQHLVERSGRQLTVEDLDRIVRDQPHVGDAARVDRQEAVADAGRMDFDAEEIRVGPHPGEFDERRAVAETDLQHARPVMAENRVQVERGGSERQPPSRHQIVERALLRARDPSAAQYVAPDGFPPGIGVHGTAGHARVAIRSAVSSATLRQPFSASVLSNSSARISIARVTPAAPPAASP